MVKLIMRSKRSLFSILILLISCISSFAQVTIGSGFEPDDNALLDLKENNTGTSTKGLLLPRVALISTDNFRPLTAHVAGMLVYNLATTGDVTPGFYINDGSKWVRTGGGSNISSIEPWFIKGTNQQATSNTQDIYQSGNVGIGTKYPLTTLHVDGLKDNDSIPTKQQIANDFVVTSTGSVGIGTTTPNQSAILDINSLNKGVLVPKVSLDTPTDTVTIKNPALGLLVFNTGEGNLKKIGFLYWNGAEWVQFVTSPSKAPYIGALDCINARMEPSRYTAGENYEGTLIIPYSGGNGAYYNGGNIIFSSGVTGLKAVLQSGYLAYGNGDLVYNLSGTPSSSSPALATFNIDAFGINCQATVGENTIKQGEVIYWHGSMPANVGRYGTIIDNLNIPVLASDYIKNMPIIEDVFRLDAAFNGPSTTELPFPFIPRIYNISDQPVKLWWGGVTSFEGRGRSNVLIAPNGFQNLDNGMYMGTGENMIEGRSTPAKALDYGSISQETMTIDVFYIGKWYRLFFTGWVDNHNSTDASQYTRELYITYQRMY